MPSPSNSVGGTLVRAASILFCLPVFSFPREPTGLVALVLEPLAPPVARLERDAAFRGCARRCTGFALLAPEAEALLFCGAALRALDCLPLGELSAA